MRISVHVDTHGLPEKLTAFTKAEARKAIRGAVGKAAGKGRTYVRQGAPVRTGKGRAAIRSSSVRGLSNTAVAKVYLAGGARGPAFYMRFQDQGTGDRHTRSGADRGVVEPQYFFERGADRLEGELPELVDVEIAKALAKSGLG